METIHILYQFQALEEKQLRVVFFGSDLLSSNSLVLFLNNSFQSVAFYRDANVQFLPQKK